jgi:hypothetical protein
MKRLLIIISFCIPNVVSAKNLDSIIVVLKTEIKNQDETIEKQKCTLDSLVKEFQYLKRDSDFSIKTNEQTITSISNQIGSASYSLTIFGILFGIAAIGLGVYVTYIERKVVTLNEKGREQLSQSEKIKSEVSEINNLIQKNIYGLFEKIKREETKHMLDRLVKIPGDIGNLSNSLLSRELEKDDFELLKKAYSKLLSEGGASLGNELPGIYQLLFFQHFLGLAIKDSEIGPNMTNYYQMGISCAFENDIVKSSEDFIKAIIDLGIHTKSKDINNYFLGLSKSKFVDSSLVYAVLFNNIPTRDQQFNIYQNIPDTEACKKVKINFGALLISKYSDGNYSSSEQSVIDEITQLNT